MTTVPRNVTVYCASSQQVDEEYFTTARQLGRILADWRITLTYGGGAVGLMGAIADSVLDYGGKVIGILPGFMDELEWGHGRVTELLVVDDMHQRKHRMIEDPDAIVALAGGCGTLEELLEAITWKRLGLHGKPIVIVNTRGYFDPLIEMLERCIEERFMRPEHRDMWTVVPDADGVIGAIVDAPPWGEHARDLATW